MHHASQGNRWVKGLAPGIEPQKGVGIEPLARTIERWLYKRLRRPQIPPREPASGHELGTRKAQRHALFEKRRNRKLAEGKVSPKRKLPARNRAFEPRNRRIKTQNVRPRQRTPKRNGPRTRKVPEVQKRCRRRNRSIEKRTKRTKKAHWHDDSCPSNQIKRSIVQCRGQNSTYLPTLGANQQTQNRPGVVLKG